ncbi:copper homeostasis membrane protein CopD [Sphingomonas sp. AP4-R1]|uniref:copper homeostasis membrane protein CopD n=1 Tax=Sphingomonas sp. AP4-R1 TaxID=2735134 RepID=UPI001493C171|nr:copper homeostasis membrane protein CopD [Sphingomonas sp. AP4-R1]QJU58271.1 copper homeostasis membrane protein CopD [Sphingomonas sp. AP4-R1]
MSDVALIWVRWALYVDLGLLFGLPLFALYALGGGRAGQRHLPLAVPLIGLAVLGLILSAVGFVIQGAAMAGVPLTRADMSILSDLLGTTALGLALKIRVLAHLVVLIGSALLGRWPRAATVVATLAGAVALATLAWGGHGAAGEGNAGWLQLAADLIHLFAAGAWVGAIAAFLILALPPIAFGDMERPTLAERALRGFAGVGTLIVALLILTGAINGFFLVGPNRVAALGQSTYGLLLIAKLLLFAAMLALAGLNRFRLTPALGLAIEQNDAPRAMALLRRSLFVEGSLAIVIFALVAWLGTLSPPVSA